MDSGQQQTSLDQCFVFDGCGLSSLLHVGKLKYLESHSQSMSSLLSTVFQVATTNAQYLIIITIFYISVSKNVTMVTSTTPNNRAIMQCSS